MEKILLIAIVIVGVIVIYAVLGLLIAFPVMWLWNWIVPDIFSLHTITYWQAYGLYLLCAILFQSNGSSSNKS